MILCKISVIDPKSLSLRSLPRSVLSGRGGLWRTSAKNIDDLAMKQSQTAERAYATRAEGFENGTGMDGLTFDSNLAHTEINTEEFFFFSLFIYLCVVFLLSFCFH